MGTRIDRPKHWGPLAPVELLRRLGAEDDHMRIEAARCGRHESPAAYIAWQWLHKQHQAGRPLNPRGLPFHAKQIVKRVQLSTNLIGW